MGKPSLKLRANKFSKNIEKRGQAKVEKAQDEGTPKVGAIALGLFIFLVAGSAIFQIIAILTKTDAGF